MAFINSLLSKLLKDFIIKNFVDKSENLNFKINSTKALLNKNKEKKEIYHPTAERISYLVQFSVGEFLSYLFPSSFQTKKEAEEYFIDFCNKAEEYGEDRELYKKDLWLEGCVNVDLLSNLKLYWNEKDKINSFGFEFKLFTPYNVKNETLQREIEKIYNDNFEHLINIGFLPQKIYDGNSTPSITFWCSERVWITPKGLNCSYWNKWGLNDRKNYGFPVDDFLKLLRINQTYQLDRTERKVLMKKFKQWHKKRPYKFKLNFKENSLQLDNQFIRVNFYTNYIYPEHFDDFIYGYKIKNIDLF